MLRTHVRQRSGRFRLLEILLAEREVGPVRAFGTVEQTLNREDMDFRERRYAGGAMVGG